MTEMETIGDLHSLAGTGLNTFRKLSDKYHTMKPGDVVRMSYYDEADPETRTLLWQELLKVRAMVVGPLGRLLAEHADSNHQVIAEGESAEDALSWTMIEHYGVHSVDDPFVAIYYH